MSGKQCILCLCASHVMNIWLCNLTLSLPQAHRNKRQLLLFICHSLPRADRAGQWGCYSNKPSCDCSNVRWDFDIALQCPTWGVWPELWNTRGRNGTLPPKCDWFCQAEGSRAGDIPQLWRHRWVLLLYVLVSGVWLKGWFKQEKESPLLRGRRQRWRKERRLFLTFLLKLRNWLAVRNERRLAKTKSSNGLRKWERKCLAQETRTSRLLWHQVGKDRHSRTSICTSLATCMLACS